MTIRQKALPEMRHPVRLRWAAPSVVLIAFLLVGCYTILKHPITTGGDGVTAAHRQEYYRDNCLDCHADYATYPYGFFYGVYPDYYFEYPRLGYYYAYPWWWDHYWYDGRNHPAVDEDGNVLEPGARADRRGALAPPYVGGAPALPSAGSGYVAPSTGGSKGGGTPGTGAGPTTPGEKIRVRAGDTTSDSSSTPGKSDTGTKAGRRGGVQP